MHKQSKRIKDTIFFVYGGGGFAMKDKIFEKESKKFEEKIKQGDKVVLVTHAPPHDTRLDVINKEHLGNKSIIKFIMLWLMYPNPGVKVSVYKINGKICQHYVQSHNNQCGLNNRKIPGKNSIDAHPSQPGDREHIFYEKRTGNHIPP